MRSILTLTILLSIPTIVQAHAIGLDVTVRGKAVEVEVYYDDDSPGAKAKVDVVSAEDKIVASGVTDDKGKWTFAAPTPGKYEVRVDGGAGHRAKKSITIPGAIQGDGVVSGDGSNRAEFTSVPWAKIAVGLSAIGMCAGAFLLASFVRRVTPRGPAPDATASSQCTALARPGD